MTELPIFVKGRYGPRGVENMRRLFVALFWLFARRVGTGLENMPPGGVIMCPNHLSRFDPPLVFSFLANRKTTVFNADTYRSSRFFRFVMESTDVIWVNRGNIGPSVIKAAVKTLKEGAILGVAPEGTRSKTGALQTGKTGAVFMAYASGAPIVPVAVTNTDRLVPSIKKLRRITLTATYGKPMYFKMAGRERPTSAQLEADTTEVMCRLAAMLPARYRGVYAEYPRTLELVAQNGEPATTATLVE
ncbi:MAG: 1-acyl-sn-glycerol-3-phosphate acyltransferase [Anaerolineales bacterium]|nr:1-acyl-sn-glycerol-3-phosphate acyltransferase [Anaerolineales bacterium]